MNNFQQFLQTARQKKSYPYLLTLASAFLASVAWYKPFTFLIFVAFVPLLELEKFIADSSWKRKYLSFFGFSFLFTLLWNVGVYWWLWNASGWMTFAAWIANGLLQTLPLIAFQVTKKASQGKFAYSAFVFSWMAFEYLHLHWDFSWIWLNLGNVFANTVSWVQWYEYTGTFGGTLWILTANVLVFKMLTVGFHRIRFALWILIPLLFSLYRFYTYREKGEPIEVVVVQPNFDCYKEKFSYNAKTGERNQPTFVPYLEQVRRHITLSEMTITPQTAFLLYPETSMHQGVIEGRELEYNDIQMLDSFLTQHPHVALITGADTWRMYGDKPMTATARFHPDIGYYDVCNSAIFLQKEKPIETYHKSQLVIGVETIPFPKVFKFLMMNLGGTVGGLGRQAEREVFFRDEQKKQGIAPVICYESVYGEFVTEYIQKGATAIGIITNDGWWGNTPGHIQHFNYGKLRAIETRRAIARAANTGISAFIDQKGNVISASQYGETTALRGNIHLNQEITFYVRMGDYLGRLAAFLASFMLLASLVKNKVIRK
ncbi:MAG: apolipoprotein N-acyltransferase [Flammeovirgaceae bacterium]|nr:apolipoprotein N-acyltransferase [Flammeovirgaceae bacterium]MDW8286472.1 apolipoprotein N-acyltransferase [Flammeovirgaceae bacterium]